ncbi:unnamed protein product, partial [Mesorhabditis belari]|uniref:Uncharacterized protein n=1 Tax=Mesorhabditis belari TaxID=2138241 RepID=A0AAF3FJS5_9BILA
MEREPNNNRIGGSSKTRYKNFVHFLRSTLHLRPPKQPPSPIEIERSSIGVIEVVTPTPSSTERLHLDSTFLSDCDGAIPSTSAPSVSSLQGDPVVVYDDPFVFVTSDGLVHIRNYYEFNARAEFRSSHSQTIDQTRLSRQLRASRIQTLYMLKGSAQESLNPPKSWGMARGGVWWASHANRESSSNSLYNIVIDDGSPIKAGLTVLQPRAFINSIWHVGVPPECTVRYGLPLPPLNSLNLPFIDDETGLLAVFELNSNI